MKKKALVLSMTVVGGLMLGGCGQSADESNMSLLDQVLEEGKITMATSPDYAPYEFIDPTKSGDEQYVGADIELGKYIADYLGVELELKIMDFSAVLAAISEGKVDIGISGIGHKPGREEAMAFSDPYNISTGEDEGLLCSGDGLLVLKDKASQYSTLSDFESSKIAAQSASIQEGLVQAQLPSATLQTIASLADGVLRVQSEKVDALAISCATGTQYANANDNLTMLPFSFEETELDGTMVGVVKGEDELVEKINEAIAEVLEEGLYQEWEAYYSDYAEDLGLDAN